MNHTITTTTSEAVAKWSTGLGEPGWLINRRKAAFESFLQSPPPPKTDEAWKYTDLARLPWEQYSVLPIPNEMDSGLRRNDKIVFSTLAVALRESPDLVRPYLLADHSWQSSEHYNGAKYVNMQDALWDEGFFVHVPANASLTAPLRGKFVVPRAGNTIFPRTIVVLEEGAQLTYIDEYASDASDQGNDILSNAAVELYLKTGTRLNYINIQQFGRGVTHLYHQYADIAKDAVLTSVTVSLGSGTTKAVIEAALKEPGASSYLFGLALGDGAQHFDHHTMQTHLAPHTASDLLYKSALKDGAKSVYTGLIRMTKDAQKSDAYQSNKNLLLSEQAKANSVPQLEIEANDVRCTHGASIGAIDHDQCYYLKSRGLSEGEATKIIARGFFEDVLQRLPEGDVRNVVERAIEQKLGGDDNG